MSTPLTQSQQAMWLLHTISGRGQLFNVAECIEFNGKISLNYLQQALTHVFKNANTLGCNFNHSDDFIPHWQANNELPLITVCSLEQAPTDTTQLVKEYISAAIDKPMDLATQSLMQFWLLRAPQKDYLLILAHHIMLDGYGFGLFIQALNRCYNALASNKSLPTLKLGSQQALLKAHNLPSYQDSLATAKVILNQWLDQMPEPMTFSDSKADVTAANSRHTATFTAQNWHLVQSAAQSTGGSPAELILAAIAASLVAKTNQHHVTLGLVMMNRQSVVEFSTPCVQSNVLPLPLALTEQYNLAQTMTLINQQIKALKKLQHYRVEDLKRERQKQGKSLNVIGPTVNLLPFATNPKFAGISSKSHILSAGTTDDIMLQVHLLADQAATIDFDANQARYSNSQVKQIQQQIFAAAIQWANQPQSTLAQIIEQLQNT